MKCLDSTFVIDFLRNVPSAVKKAQEIDDEGIVTTRINFFEVLLGEFRLHSVDDEHVLKAKEFFNRVEILELNEATAMKAAKLGADILKRGVNINPTDVIIAGILLANGGKTIITNDKDFEKIAELKIEHY